MEEYSEVDEFRNELFIGTCTGFHREISESIPEITSERIFVRILGDFLAKFPKESLKGFMEEYS